MPVLSELAIDGYEESDVAITGIPDVHLYSEFLKD